MARILIGIDGSKGALSYIRPARARWKKWLGVDQLWSKDHLRAETTCEQAGGRVNSLSSRRCGGMSVTFLRTLNATQGSRKGLDAVGIYGISA